MDVLRPYEPGIFMLDESKKIQESNRSAKEKAQKVIQALCGPNAPLAQDGELRSKLDFVNRESEKLNQYVYGETKRLLELNKIVGVLGGDHSVPFGALQAIAEKYRSFGILHFDAHSDTRKAYEGFTWSHASIMYNVLQHISEVTKLVQVGIRDICEDEIQFNQSCKNRVHTFFDRTLAQRKFEGTPWSQIGQEIVNSLPKQIWVSFDIDGLDPRFCPHTGTPVPGGLDFHEVNYLFALLVKSGREIIGFDLNEVAPNLENPRDNWDANVGARLLYKLSAWTLASLGKASLYQ
jgi:agmatinase